MQINDLKEKYKDYKEVVKYLEQVQEDILQNLDDFRRKSILKNNSSLCPGLKVMKARL